MTACMPRRAQSLLYSKKADYEHLEANYASVNRRLSELDHAVAQKEQDIRSKDQALQQMTEVGCPADPVPRLSQPFLAASLWDMHSRCAACL